jgi:outer membrane protein
MMRKSLSVVVVIGLSATFLRAAQEPEPEPAWRALSRETVELPAGYADRAHGEGPVLELTLKDAIRLALTNNLAIAIENFNEEIFRERIVQTQGFYDPRFRLRMGWNSVERPSTSVLDAGRGIPTNISKTWTAGATLEQNVPTGGSLQLQFRNNRAATNSAFAIMNPQFGSDLQFSFIQPLMRGFRETQTERQLKLYNLDTAISDSQFQQRVSEIVQEVERQFWELVFAIENYEARRQSMELAVIQFENNKKRAGIGVLAPIEITSSRAEVSTREQELIQTEVQIILAENGLKNLLAPDPEASLWHVTLLPVDRPTLSALALSMDDAVQSALSRRPELEQVRLRNQRNDVDRSFLRKQGKPQLNLIAAVISTGVAGQVFRDQLVDTTGDGIPDTSLGREPFLGSPFFGNFSDTWGQALGFDYMTYNLAVEVEIPIRNRTNEAELAELALSDRRLVHQRRQAEQNIVVEVRNAYRSIETQQKRWEAARMARELTAEQLRGENRRFEAGLSTNFEVLRYQRDLADAQVRELRALIDYQLAVSALRKATYTIIEDNDIVLARSDR